MRKCAVLFLLLLVVPLHAQENLARGKPVTVSSALDAFPADMAVDGVTEGANWWGSGEYAPGWIEIDLEAVASITGLRLTLSQDPPGRTEHHIMGRGPGEDWRELHTFDQITVDGYELDYSPPQPWEGIRYVRIETTDGPSWVSWREIEIFGTVEETAQSAADDEAASVIFYNGQVVTMEPEQPTAEALAIRDHVILAVGDDETVLAHEGAGTALVDLDGHALLPGFVDPHTHLFNEAGNMGNDFDVAQQLALRNGITTLGNMWSDEGFLAAMRDYDAAGHLRARTSIYLAYNSACGEVNGRWYREHPPTRERGETLRVGGVKMYADGGSCGIPAFTVELEGGGYGDLWLDAAAMAPVIEDAQAMGHQVVIHALGDRAVENAQDALAMALDGGPNTYRHRIDHNSVVRPELLDRYSEIGIVPVIFGTYFIGDSCPGPSMMPSSTHHWDWPYRELVDANPELHIAWHGDDPFVGPVSPLLELYSMTTPYEVGRDGVTICDTPERLLDRALTPEEALPMMTREAAYALFREEEVGSLRPGKFADVIVLSANPLAVEPEAIKDIAVWATLVDGETVYCAQEAYCP